MFEARNAAGRTPHSLAAGAGKAKAVKYPADCEADVNQRDNEGQSPLIHAVLGKRMIVIKYLAEHPRTEIDLKDLKGRTPLSYAFKSLEVVQCLMGNGADVRSQDIRGRPMFRFTVETASLKMVKAMIEECGGIDVDQKDFDGRTPLSYAAEQRPFDDLAELIGVLAMANLDSKDHRGRTPLSYAAESGRIEAVKALCTCKSVDINSKDLGGRSPLSYAAEHGCIEAVQFLVDLEGVELDIPDRAGLTPFAYAMNATEEADEKSQGGMVSENVQSRSSQVREIIARSIDTRTKGCWT